MKIRCLKTSASNKNVMTILTNLELKIQKIISKSRQLRLIYLKTENKSSSQDKYSVIMPALLPDLN